MVILCFLGSILSITMVELSIELPFSPLIEACAHSTKLLSKVYVEQHLEALDYFCEKAHTMILVLGPNSLLLWLY